MLAIIGEIYYNHKGAAYENVKCTGRISFYSAGYETRGCDTPGRFAMDERDGNFRGAMSTFQNRRRRENNGKTKNSYPFKSV